MQASARSDQTLQVTSASRRRWLQVPTYRWKGSSREFRTSLREWSRLSPSDFLPQARAARSSSHVRFRRRPASSQRRPARSWGRPARSWWRPAWSWWRPAWSWWSPAWSWRSPAWPRGGRPPARSRWRPCGWCSGAAPPSRGAEATTAACSRDSSNSNIASPEQRPAPSPSLRRRRSLPAGRGEVAQTPGHATRSRMPNPVPGESKAWEEARTDRVDQPGTGPTSPPPGS